MFLLQKSSKVSTKFSKKIQPILKYYETAYYFIIIFEQIRSVNLVFRWNIFEIV